MSCLLPERSSEDEPSNSVICLSVRTGFDLLLSACAFPRGSEVLMSALNVDGMFRIPETHGLTPVPLDIGTATFLPDVQAIKDAITPGTRMLVIAQLFGTQADLGEIGELCHDRGILLVEDRAQAFNGAIEIPGAPWKVFLYSFGPIKAATALGGGVITLGDASLAAKLRAREAAFPRYSLGWFFKRTLKYAALKAVSHQAPYGLMSHLLGKRLESFVSGLARGFGSGFKIGRLRKRPPIPMVRLLARRLKHSNNSTFERAQRRGEALQNIIPEAMRLPGLSTANNVFWLFPVFVADPSTLIERLRAEGFDASMRGSLVVLDADGSRPTAANSRRFLNHTVFLPFYDSMPESELERMAAITRTVSASR